MKRNAMSDHAKELRRRVLLDAARGLYRQRRELPPVSEIANAAGLAKGTVYLYFKTKEEIFIALLEHDFAQLFAALTGIFADLPASPVAAARFAAGRYAQLILSLEDLLPLASLANGVLEQNLALDVMRRFKTLIAAGLVTAGRQLEASFPGLDEGHGATLLLQTYALTLGLWQALDYPSALRAMLGEDALRALDRQFTNELEAAVRTQWLGSLLMNRDP